jgi:hypothetical protein
MRHKYQGMPSKRNALDFKGKTGRKIFLRIQHLSASSGRISHLQLTVDHSDSVAEIYRQQDVNVARYAAAGRTLH